MAEKRLTQQSLSLKFEGGLIFLTLMVDLYCPQNWGMSGKLIKHFFSVSVTFFQKRSAFGSKSWGKTCPECGRPCRRGWHRMEHEVQRKLTQAEAHFSSIVLLLSTDIRAQSIQSLKIYSPQSSSRILPNLQPQTGAVIHFSLILRRSVSWTGLQLSSLQRDIVGQLTHWSHYNIINLHL